VIRAPTKDMYILVVVSWILVYNMSSCPYIAAMTAKKPKITNTIKTHRHHICLLLAFDVRAAPNQRLTGPDPLRLYHFGVLLPASISLRLVALDIWLNVSCPSSRNFLEVDESPLMVLMCIGWTVTMTSAFFS
jgi:hypothetical protein